MDLLVEVRSVIKPGADCVMPGCSMWHNPRIARLRQHGKGILPAIESVLTTIDVPVDRRDSESRLIRVGIAGLIDFYLLCADEHQWDLANFLRNVQLPIYQLAVDAMWSRRGGYFRSIIPGALFDVLTERMNDHPCGGKLIISLKRSLMTGMLSFDRHEPEWSRPHPRNYATIEEMFDHLESIKKALSES